MPKIARHASIIYPTSVNQKLNNACRDSKKDVQILLALEYRGERDEYRVHVNDRILVY